MKDTSLEIVWLWGPTHSIIHNGINSNSQMEFGEFFENFRLNPTFQGYIYDTFPDRKKNKSLHLNEAKIENMNPYSKDKKPNVVIP